MLQGGMMLPQGGAAGGGGGDGGVAVLPPAPDLNVRPQAPSPFAVVAGPPPPQLIMGGPPAAPPATLVPGGGGGAAARLATSASPFAAGPLMNTISEAFPNWQQGQGQGPGLETGEWSLELLLHVLFHAGQKPLDCISTPVQISPWAVP